MHFFFSSIIFRRSLFKFYYPLLKSYFLNMLHIIYGSRHLTDYFFFHIFCKWVCLCYFYLEKGKEWFLSENNKGISDTLWIIMGEFNKWMKKVTRSVFLFLLVKCPLLLTDWEFYSSFTTVGLSVKLS